MSTRIIHGDCRTVLPTLPEKSVQCCVTSPRGDRGRFANGVHAYRQPRPHWEKDWLVREYITNGRSTGEIAAEIGTTDANVLFWLRKHGIPRRSVSQARALKAWVVSGPANGMYGRNGSANPRFVDGSSPDRQRAYVQAIGHSFLSAVYQRDGYACRRCGALKSGPKSIHAHHIKPWAGNPDIRFDLENAVTLCRPCHSWVHSKKNVDREWLS